MPLTAINLAVGAVLRGELVVEVPYGAHVDQANHVQAFETLLVQVNPEDSESPPERRLGTAWRVKFDEIDPSVVHKLSWRVDQNSSHEFILWPLEARGPFTTKFDGFKLTTLREADVSRRDRVVKQISEHANVTKAKEEYDKLALLYARVPNRKLRDGSSGAQCKHWLLREMLAEMAKYRAGWRWEEKSKVDKNTWLATEREWHVKLITNNKGATDQDSLSRLTEATSLWWQFVVSQDFTLSKGWDEKLPSSQAPFKDAEHAKQFRHEWSDVNECLTQEGVQAALDRTVTETQHTFSDDIQKELRLWTRHAKARFQEATIGQIQAAINGVYQPYRRIQEGRRASAESSGGFR